MHKLLVWWQLLRIGNVFTAASNVIAGFLIAQGGWQPVGPLLVLIAASSLLYAAGMVLNDVFDAELDAVERPERPIPSGRISPGVALMVGWGLLGAGLFSACVVGWLLDQTQPWIIATLLAMCVVGYDAGLKNTALGPLTMGLCRFLNVLLGASVVESISTAACVFAVIVGVYTLGITYYARSENENRTTFSHKLGKGILGVAIAGLLLFPLSIATEDSFRVDALGWCASWLVVLLATVGTFWLSNREATLATFRGHVTALLHGFILIDACVSVAVAGWTAGLIVAALLLPTWIASRFAPMT